MSNCCTCFGRGTVIGPDGQPKACPNPACDAPASSADEFAATFTDWHRQYDWMVRRVARTQLHYGDAALVEDISQEVWLRLWAYAMRGNEIERPAPLLATMARQAVWMHYRRSARQKRPQTRAVDYTDRLVEWIIATDSAEQTALGRMTARETIAALPKRAVATRERAFSVAAVA